MRTWDAIKIGAAIKHFLETDETVDPIEWLANPVNIALENDSGDLALFEYGFPTKKVYAGHYYFKSRGRQAIDAAKGFLDELFNSCYNIHIVMGLVPTVHLAAKWLTRRVGFKFYDIEEIDGKQYDLFILTKKEFNNE